MKKIGTDAYWNKDDMILFVFAESQLLESDDLVELRIKLASPAYNI